MAGATDQAPRIQVLGELRDGVAVVLDTETGEARLAYGGPSRSGVSRFRSFLDGFVSAFDLWGGADLSDLSRGFERDAEALAGDWRRVGDSLRWAMNQIDQEATGGRKG